MASSHLKALLKKNWILWRRNLCCSILEILIPVLFAVAFKIFREALPPDEYGKTKFYDEPSIFTYSDVTLYPQAIKKCELQDKIALGPPGDSIVEELEQIFESTAYNFTVKYYDTMEEMDERTQETGYEKSDDRICFGVYVTKNNDDSEYEYHLRFNTSRSSPRDDHPKTTLPRTTLIKSQQLTLHDQYTEDGFITLQWLVDSIILKQATGGTGPLNDLTVEVSSVTMPPYKEDNLYTTIQGTGQSLISMPMLLPFLRMTNGILREKEKRIREGMKMMGLQNSAFYISWFITYFLIFTITSLLVSAVLQGLFLVHSSYGLIFLWHWEFGLAFMAMGLLVTVFFSKAKVGNVAAFVFAFLVGWLEQISGDVEASETAKFWTSFGPQTSISLALNQIFNFESAQVGLTSENVDLLFLNYKMSWHYITMAIDFVVFLLLAAYLDQVLPSEFGLRKHPLFCFKRSKRKGSQSKKIDEEALKSFIDKAHQGDPANFEPVESSLKNQDYNYESIIVSELRKIFGAKKVAVDGVSFSMYQGQIFALLGHNGAGKTTTINMITGLYETTGGTTSVLGMDIHDEMDDIRKIMGVCPQHDILFDMLTVREHLELFAVFKGMNPDEIKGEIDQMIKDLDLEDKRDYLAKNLSGGQKRKLSTGIAFVGGSKFILLDEPSSGMDTSARRRLWDMLKNYKSGRIVLLTTHYMDEADYLGDRIAIMGEGRLQCLGSPLFLKSKFGVGYSLTIVKSDININSDPIIKLITDKIPQSKLMSNVSAELTIQLPLETEDQFKDLFETLDQRKEELKISSYGVSVTTLEEVFLNVSNILVPKSDKTDSAKQHGTLNQVTSAKGNEDLDNFDLEKEREDPRTWPTFKRHFSALALKRFHYFKRDKKGLCLELFLPIIMVIAGTLLTKIDYYPDPTPLEYEDLLYGHVNDVAYNGQELDGTNIEDDLIEQFNSANFDMTEVDTDSIEDFDDVIYEERDEIDPYRKFSVFFKNIDNANHDYRYLTFIDTRAQDAAPFAVNKINQALLRYATGNDDIKLTMIANPFPLTPSWEQVENAIDGFAISLIYTIGMSFIPASIATFIVKERELNVKHQQIVSGVSISAYWFSNLFVDLIKYLFPGILCVLMALAFDAGGLIDDGKFGVLWAVFMLYGPSIISFVYLTSFLFKDYGAAQMATFFFNFGMGFIGGIAVSVLRIIDATNSAAKVLHWFFRFFPSFSFTYSLLNMGNREIYALLEDHDEVKSPWDIDIAGGDVLYLAFTPFLYFILVFVVEYLRTKRSFMKMFQKDVPRVEQEEDSDVVKERTRITESGNKDMAIKVDELRKVYQVDKKTNKVAVDKISFGIADGECFALLGVNGAGKTTTFKMLCGEIIPTAGKITIRGFDVPDKIEDARKYIGYCPQFDALLENLTAKEHLQLYASIKGIPVSKRELIVDKLLNELKLKQYENIPAGTYSGGNKRKLSVAIAMIGNPPIVFLDEPSNGMDPEARRFMWNVISRISTQRKQSSVILTTHSMEEAEALATKIAIQVDGNLKCIGSAQHIKNRYGGGLEIELKTKLPSHENIEEMLKKINKKITDKLTRDQVKESLKLLKLEDSLGNEIKEDGSGSAIYAATRKHAKVDAKLVVDWILMEEKSLEINQFFEKNFTGVTMIEHYQSFLRIKIDTTKLSKVFGVLEANKIQLEILQYSVKQTSIEQIFNAFAAKALKPITDDALIKSLKDVDQKKAQDEEIGLDELDEGVQDDNDHKQIPVSKSVLSPEKRKNGMDTMQVKVESPTGKNREE